MKFWFLKTFLLCAIGLLVFACSSEKQTQTPSTQDKPNIILIVSDDQGYADLSVNGTLDDVSTPNIDLLASQGTRFTNAYATSPICNTYRCGKSRAPINNAMACNGMEDPAFQLGINRPWQSC